MTRPLLAFDISKEANAPLFVRIARAIIQDIQRGRLQRGAKLPGTRSLAAELSVNRNTVVAAYDELALQGWIHLEPSRGAVVADDLPDLKDPPPTKDRRPRQGEGAQRVAWKKPPALVFTDGTPDPRLVPATEFARAFRRALKSSAFLNPSGYGDPRGSLKLRVALADLLANTRGLAVGPDEILLTRGSQMGLFLAARAIAASSPATIAVEDPGYPLAWEAFRSAGVRVVGTPVDRDGVNVDVLREAVARDETIRGVLVTPHHQYPTTVTLGAGRRLALLATAATHGLAIIEDDYDHDYRYECRPVLPLAASTSFKAPGPVIYLGSLSKLLAPGLRLGYAVAAPDVLQRMIAVRETIDRQGDVPLELAVAELLEDGELARQARRARKVYKERRDLLVQALQRELGDVLAFSSPSGGLAIWATVHGDIDLDLWARTALDKGLLVSPGRCFAFGDNSVPNAFRLGFAALNAKELENAVRALARSRPT